MKKKWIIILIMLALFVFSLAAEEKKSPYIQHDIVLIKGGEFTMGKEVPPPKKGDKGNKKKYINNPSRKVMVNSFYIDKYEVTNYEYYQFCLKTNRKLPVFWGMHEFHCGLDFPNHPVVGVSYLDATAYAKWRGMRLPTEAEWEIAARGGLAGKKFPNSNKLDIKNINYGGKHMGTTRVGSFPANGFGLYDMSGNVREWVLDWYKTDYYKTGSAANPQGPEVGRFRVIRGGGFFVGPGCVTVYRRNALAANWCDFAVGFRCAKDAGK